MINKSLKIRIYPNKLQIEFFEKTFNACRFVYNYYLSEKTQHWLDTKDLVVKPKLKSKTEKELKEEFEFLKDVDAIALQQTRIDLEFAFKRYFDNHKKKTIPKLTEQDLGKLSTKSFKTEISRYLACHPGHPQFKTKKNPKTSYRTSDSNDKKVLVDNGKNLIWVPKIKWIKFKHSHVISARYKSITISKNSLNEYYVSLLFEEDIDLEPLESIDETKAIGLDMSAKELAIASNNETCFSNEKFYRRSERTLKIRQRKLSKKVLGSNNFKEAKLIVAKVHKKVERHKDYFIHKITKYLSDFYDLISVEDLNIKGMQKFSPGLSKTVTQDLSWYKFTNILEYKMKWKNKHLVKIDRFFPSSKLCGNCGQINNELKLSDRTWNCDCGESHNRDKNASFNILREGLRIVQSQGINLVKNSTAVPVGSYAC